MVLGNMGSEGAFSGLLGTGVGGDLGLRHADRQQCLQRLPVAEVAIPASDT